MWDKSEKKVEVKRIKVSSIDPSVGHYSRNERRNNIYRILCLSALGIILIGAGIGLILAGSFNDIQDLIVIGAIFIGAGVVFIIMIFTAVSRPNRRNKVDRVSSEPGPEAKDNDDVYIRKHDTNIDDPEEVFRKHRPSEINLYGYYGNEKLKIHLPEPNPMVAFPSSANPAEVTRGPVVTMTLRETTDLEHV